MELQYGSLLFQDYIRTGNSPTLLYGYGGFGVNGLPTFRPDRIVFIKNFNGVFALPNIRGGGYGHCVLTF